MLLLQEWLRAKYTLVAFVLVSLQQLKYRLITRTDRSRVTATDFTSISLSVVDLLGNQLEAISLRASRI
jgi:hypothetical protein